MWYCKYRKKLVDKLVEECIENFDGNEMIYSSTLKNHKNVCGSCERKSCTVCIVLFVIVFLIIISISSAFIGAQKKNNIHIKLNTSTWATIPLKYKWGKYQRNKH